MDVANYHFLIEQSGVNLKDALRRLHIREYNGNLRVGVSAFILIRNFFSAYEMQIYA